MAKVKKFPYFYTILALLVLVGVCCVAYGLGLLNSWMADYESTRPKYVAENVFETHFKDLDVGALIKTKPFTVSPAETEADLIKYVTDQIGSGEIKYAEAASGSITGDVLKYVVSAGDYKFGQFTVVDSGEKTEYGNPIYVMGDYEFFYKVDTVSIKIVAPSDATVKVNGYTLDQSYVTGTEDTESCAHMPDRIFHNGDPTQGIKYSTYVISGLIYKTDNITVTDKYGAPCPVTKDENGVFQATVNYNEELKEQYSDIALAFSTNYAKFAQACGTFNGVKPYIDPNSDIYEKIRTLEFYYVHGHNSCEFLDEQTFEFYEYAPGVFSCRVKYTWHAIRANAREQYEYIDLSLYFHEVNGEYKLYDMMTHSDFSVPEE
ncbi:MAG: hypothetical protein IIW63_02770 [Clostridia bacterium]|nr:hypothetical protein [Clostridia bacterium]